MSENESFDAAREAMHEMISHPERYETSQQHMQRYLSAAAYHAKQAEILVGRAQTAPPAVKPRTGARKWSVEISIDQRVDQRLTRAEAQLRSGDKARLVGEGIARRNPADMATPEIGEELAAARALADLSHQLLELAAEDIQHLVGRG